jgi:hypothetical protein
MTFVEDAVYMVKGGNGIDSLRNQWRQMRERYHDDLTFQTVATRFITMPESELRRRGIATAEAWGWSVQTQ